MEPPLPIPNREVKRVAGDDTTLWESSFCQDIFGYNMKRAPEMGLFSYTSLDFAGYIDKDSKIWHNKHKEIIKNMGRATKCATCNGVIGIGIGRSSYTEDVPCNGPESHKPEVTRTPQWFGLIVHVYVARPHGEDEAWYEYAGPANRVCILIALALICRTKITYDWDPIWFDLEWVWLDWRTLGFCGAGYEKLFKIGHYAEKQETA